MVNLADLTAQWKRKAHCLMPGKSSRSEKEAHAAHRSELAYVCVYFTLRLLSSVQ